MFSLAAISIRDVLAFWVSKSRMPLSSSSSSNGFVSPLGSAVVSKSGFRNL